MAAGPSNWERRASFTTVTPASPGKRHRSETPEDGEVSDILHVTRCPPYADARAQVQADEQQVDPLRAQIVDYAKRTIDIYSIHSNYLRSESTIRRLLPWASMCVSPKLAIDEAG